MKIVTTPHHIFNNNFRVKEQAGHKVKHQGQSLRTPHRICLGSSKAWEAAELPVLGCCPWKYQYRVVTHHYWGRLFKRKPDALNTGNHKVPAERA